MRGDLAQSQRCTEASLCTAPIVVGRGALSMRYLSAFRVFRAEQLFLWQLLDSDITKADGAVIALQKNRARLVHFVVDFAARRLCALHVIVNLSAIENDGNLVAGDRRFHGLPLVSRLGGKLIRRFEIVNCAVAAA